MLSILLVQFGTSEENVKCVEDNCPEPCEYTDYETSLSYADQQRNVFIRKLNSFLNETEDSSFSIFKDFKNMSYPEQKEHIE